MKTEKVYKYIQILSCIGIVLSLYLLWQQLWRPAFQPCNVNSFINCNAVISGPVAKTFGIPTPLIGLIGYIVILISSKIKNIALLLSMATFGLIFCLWLAYVELFQLRVICPVCIMCQLVMGTIFIFSVLLFRKKDVTDDTSK